MKKLGLIVALLTALVPVFARAVTLECEPKATSIVPEFHFNEDTQRLRFDFPEWDRVYILEFTDSLSSPVTWQQRVIIKPSGESPRFSEVATEKQRYYRVWELPTFGTGQPVTWQVNVRPSQVSFFTFTWIGDDGVSRSLTSSDTFTVYYQTTGVKTITVTAFGGGTQLSASGAVYITDRPGFDNLVSNSRFEQLDGDGEPVGWSQDEWGNISTDFELVDGPTGKAAKVSVFDRTDEGDAKWYFDRVPVIPGALYQYKDDFFATGENFITLELEHTNGDVSYDDVATLGGSGVWQKADVSFTVPVDVRALTVTHLIQEGELTIDNVLLRKVVPTSPPIIIPPPVVQPPVVVPPVTPPQSRGLISLDFDDMWLEHFTVVYPMLKEFGLHATFYAVTSHLGQQKYMDENQLRELYLNGNQIGAHTKTHPHLMTLTLVEAWQEVKGSRDAIRAIGAGNGDMFAYPFGEYNDAIVDIVKRNGFIGARATNDGVNEKKKTDLYLLNRRGVGPGTSLEQMKAWVDEAELRDVSVILLIHHVDNTGIAYSTTPEKLRGLLQYIQQKKYRVGTASECIKFLSQ